jgi:hypothetical protein
MLKEAVSVCYGMGAKRRILLKEEASQKLLVYAVV